MSGKTVVVFVLQNADGLKQWMLLTKATQNMHFHELGWHVKIACQILLSGDMWSQL